MTKLSRNFVAGRMNKMYDERVVPNGEYIDALNIRMGSTEKSEVGVIENTMGNIKLTTLAYIDGTPLSDSAVCIGTYSDSSSNVLYWFVHDPNFTASYTGKLDLIVSFNVLTNILTYHIISVSNDYSTEFTTLNFNPKYLITGVSMIEDLLFFTDDYNPPRCINVTRNYSNPVGGVDQFSAESLLVIKKPPVSAPTVQPVNIGGQSNYMDTRFISFAYRYQYQDSEYSATSQWSDISFVPKPFGFVDDSLLNSGMENSCNAAIVTYNSGGPLVVGIDLLFKQADGNIIKVIEKINKKDSGLVDNTDYSFTFSNSKIFTILPESELLRLYDNVPLLAKAQTIMGNRLMYGNYVEGYDMIDGDGNPVMLEFSTDLVSTEVGLEDLPTRKTSHTYGIDGPHLVTDANLYFDLAGKPLVAGSSITISMILTHGSFTGTVPAPQDQVVSVPVNFTMVLNNSYTSVYQFATSVEFQNAIGTLTNIQSVYPDQSCNGTTLTDIINCQLPSALNGYTKYESGVSGGYQPVAITAYPSSTEIALTMVAMQYVDDPTAVTASFFEYYTISFASVSYQRVATPKSLHSNRGYEIGIVYMDDFGRSTTALVSPNNTEHVPCSASDLENQIYVTIPPTQRPPYWATRYKFVCKPDAEGYETIISSIYFIDPINPNSCYILVEGENARKVEVGDRLIVKADTSGAVNSCQYVTVLDKQSYGKDFITPVTGATVPAGVYLKISLNNITIVEIPHAIVAPGTKSTKEVPSHCAEVDYPVSIEDPVGTWNVYTIPIGSKIKLSFKFTNYKYSYEYEKELTSSADYSSFESWWIGDQVALTLNDGNTTSQPPYCPQVNNVFISGHGTIPTCDCFNYYRFDTLGSGEVILRIKGNRNITPFITSSVKVNIQVYRSVGTLVFETEPTDALPDVFYENNLSFAIENGNHLGNVQDQDIPASVPAIINTGFFNCFTFGNGVESYKILDSAVGHSFSLGQRVTSTAAQDYGRSDRFADITYSGVYNTETNINKLNEFNLGLADFKNLEASFGPIYILDGRETDVLVLQEDKISYVLAGKNLLSDSTGGGVVSSVPEVLGTQIARTEKYGISFNPESYVQWGYDRYFTDVKRGAVIQLKGTSYSDEQLAVVSDMNMRTWFRDTFIESFATQKLGAFDPYMDEYVLSINNKALPINPSCLECGVSQNFILSGDIETEMTKEYCVNFGPIVGYVDVNYNITSLQEGGQIDIEVDYNGEITSNIIDVTGPGVFSFSKSLNYVEFATIKFKYLGNVQLDITVNCPYSEYLSVIQVVVANNSEAGETIHAEYRYFDGPYVSPLQSNAVTFASGTDNPLVSLYNRIDGIVGTGSTPTSFSTVRVQTNKIVPDTYDFSPLNDSFRYLYTGTLYNNTPSEIAALIAASNLAYPNQHPSTNIYYAEFINGSVGGGYLYLIWDLRKSQGTELCYSEIIDDVCCGCAPCEACELIRIEAGESDCSVYFPDGWCGDDPGSAITIDVLAGQFYENCFNPNQDYKVLSGDPIVSKLACGCSYCEFDCSKWVITSDGSLSSIFKVDYIDCLGASQQAEVTSPNSQIICVMRGTTPTAADGSGTINLLDYCTNC